MGALDRRTDRLGETTAAIPQELATLIRWANRLDRENLETLNAQAARAAIGLVNRTHILS
jgi:hypothetical protein